MFEEQEAEKGGKVEGRSGCGGCGGCEVEPRSSVNRKIWTAGELHQMRRKEKNIIAHWIWTTQPMLEV
jgi:hypothetical protein